MKRIVLTVLLAVMCLCGYSQDNTQKALKFDTMAHDFGKVSEKGGVVSYEFWFTNTGSTPIVLTQVVTSCTCTRADYSKKPIPAGGRSVIKISYDPKKQNGTFFKAIQVYSNAPEKRVIITAKGEVVKQ